jgi:hypothetical protein
VKPLTHLKALADDAFVGSYDAERSLREDPGGFDAVDRAAGGTLPEDAPIGEDASFLDRDNRRGRIATRAYQRYLENGSREGHDVEDWLEAEREMAAEDSDDR